MKRTRKGSFGGHAALSLTAAVLTAAITVATLPFIVSRLGLPSYGLLSLLFVASAYAGILDFGFSWTSNRFIADAIEREDEAMLDSVLRASASLYAAVGLVGLTALGILAGPLVDHVFNAPADVRDAGISAARLVALSFPFGMMQVFAGAALRGAQRFDLSALLHLASSGGASLAIVTVLAAGGHLVAVAAALATSQAVVAALGLIATKWVLPSALSFGHIDPGMLRALAHFSTRVMVGNLGAQLLYLPNRLAVGVLLPLGTVGVFSVPFALAQRLQFVPVAVVSAALPTMTAARARGSAEAFWKTFWEMTGVVGAALLPVAALAFIWAPTLLQVWFSSDFGGDAAWVLRIALLAGLLNALGAMLAVACDSAGAPGISAAASVAAGVANVTLAFLLTAAFGIIGAAVALLTSLALLSVVIAVMGRRGPLPGLRLPRLRRFARVRAGVAGGLACLWLAAAAALDPEIDSRMSLGVLGLFALAIAYGGIAMTVGPRRLFAWAFQPTPTRASQTPTVSSGPAPTVFRLPSGPAPACV